MARKVDRQVFGEPFKINVEDEDRNRQLKIFDAVSFLAGKSPLVNTRQSARTGDIKQEPVFMNMGRHRDTVFAEPTNLFAGQLAGLEELVSSDKITVDNLKKTLGAFGSRVSSQLDNYRYAAGLDIHHDNSVAAHRRALNHLPIPIQGQHLGLMAQRGNVGNTHLTQELHAYLPAEHNAAHFALISGVPFKGDGMRNLGDVENMIGPELVDHFYRVSGDMQSKLADNADDFAREARKVYAGRLKEATGLDVKPELLGSAAILPGKRISASKEIRNETERRIGKKGMRDLTNQVSREVYPDGVNSIIPNAKKVTFTSPAQVEKRLGKEQRSEVERLRAEAVQSNTEGLMLHPGSMDDLPGAVKLRQIIDLLGVKNEGY